MSSPAEPALRLVAGSLARRQLTELLQEDPQAGRAALGRLQLARTGLMGLQAATDPSGVTALYVAGRTAHRLLVQRRGDQLHLSAVQPRQPDAGYRRLLARARNAGPPPISSLLARARARVPAVAGPTAGRPSLEPPTVTPPARRPSAGPRIQP